MRFGRWMAAVAMAALLAPLAALAEDPPVPLPRPADRMPQGADAAKPDEAKPADATTPASDVPTQGTDAPADDTNPADDSTGDDAMDQLPTAAQAAAAVAVAKDPQPVVLQAKITADGAQIQQGLIWRVYAAGNPSGGELPLAAKSTDAVAHFTLKPGEYVVHVAYGRAQATDTLTVTSGEADKSMVLDAGALRLNAAVSGDVPIPINLLRFDIYTPGAETDQTAVAQDLGPGDIVTLNAGTYHVVSHFGVVNAVVRADLRVEPGKLTEATLYHKASQVSFKLVSQSGGEAIADIDWTVKTADGANVFTDTGAFPTTVLEQGDYLVLAKRGDTVYSREFEVQPGPAREIEVLTTVYQAPGSPPAPAAPTVPTAPAANG